MKPTLSPRLRSLLMAPVLAFGVLSILATSDPVTPHSVARIAVDNPTSSAVIAIEEGGIIFLQDWDGGIGAWSQPVNKGPGRDAAVAMDGAGNAVAAWADPATGVYSAYFNGAGWTSDVLASGGPDNYYAPQVHLDRVAAVAGAGMAAWEEQAPPPAPVRIWAAPLDSTGLPGIATELVGIDTHAADPRAARDLNGDGLVVWREGLFVGDYATPRIYASHYVSGVWDTVPTKLDNNTADEAVYDVQMGVDVVGDAVVVWSQNEAVMASHYVAGTWDALPAVVDAGTPGNIPDGLQLAVDATGDAFAVWGDGNAIVAARYSATGGTWTSQVIGNTPAGHSPGRPAIDADGNGGAVAAWSGSDVSPISYAIYDTATGWGTPVATGADGNNVDIATDGLNAATIGFAWTDANGNAQAFVF